MSRLRVVLVGLLSLVVLLAGTTSSQAKDRNEKLKDAVPGIAVAWENAQPQYEHELQVVFMYYNVEMTLAEVFSHARFMVPNRTNELGCLVYEDSGFVPFSRVVVCPKDKRVIVQDDLSAGASLSFATKLRPYYLPHLLGALYDIDTSRIVDCEGNAEKCSSLMKSE